MMQPYSSYSDIDLPLHTHAHNSTRSALHTVHVAIDIMMYKRYYAVWIRL